MAVSQNRSDASSRANVDYVLLVDVFGLRSQGLPLGAVHAMAVTGLGEMAYGAAWNSYQPLYKEFKPTSLNEAARMVVADLTRPAPR